MPLFDFDVYLCRFIEDYMIVEFLLILCLFVSFTGWGAWTQMLLRNKTDSFSLAIILGLSFFGIWVCLLSFFIPLDRYVEVVLLIVSVIPFFFKKLRTYVVPFPKALLKSTGFWLFCIIIVLAGAYYPFRPDHFYYYEPTLSWLNQYGLIVGVANIDWSLGQMSIFHLIQAGLDQTVDPFQRINVFITVLFLVYLFERKSYLLLFVIPLCFLFMQAPSPDVVIFLFSLIVVNELCFNYQAGNYSSLFLISAFTFVIKPVAFWLPAWTWVVGFFLHKEKVKDYRIYLIPGVLIVLFLIKNVIASSTLFYPLTFTKLPTHWLPDLRILEISNQKASVFMFSKYFTIDQINAMSFSRKIYYWLSINRLQTIVNCFMVITLVVFGVFSFLKKRFMYLSLWILIVIKSILIFSFSGQFRFMLDGIFPLLFIFFYPVRRIGQTKIFVAGLSLFLLFLAFISYPPLLKHSIPNFRLTRWMRGFTKQSLWVPQNYVLKKYTEEKLGNLDFYVSSYFVDYDTPPPALKYGLLKQYHALGIFPQMNDSSNIHKGFYMKLLTPEEKEELGEIIKTVFPDG